MATVTKLKAAVNNKNLPILGSDGTLYNYYIGRWQNTVSALGYIPTSQEVTALNVFIEDGINNGWIDRIKYFMPFIGSETAPLTGMVPLIDNVADYELATDSVPAGLFSFVNGKITCMGKNDSVNTETLLPISSTQLGITDCNSFYADITYNSADDIDTGIKGYIMSTRGDNNCYISIRKGGVNAASMQYAYRRSSESGSTALSIGSGTPTVDELPQEMGIFLAKYTIDGISYRKRSTLWQGETKARSASTKVEDEAYPAMQYRIGTLSHALDIAVNTVGVIDPFITDSELMAFNNAVFNLTLALGRRSV